MTIAITVAGKKLLFWGALLFLIGLLQGGLIPLFVNPRMALSAHLAAVQNGMALMIFGLFWGLLTLSQRWLTVAYYSAVASLYLIWFAMTLAAAVGAGRALPIAGAGFTAGAVGEAAVEGIVTLGAGLSIVSALLITVGLFARLRRG